jgi:hypothetical protein
MASSNNVTVGSLAIRGSAGHIRHLLNYCGIPFQNKLYGNIKEWIEDRPKT